MGARCESSRRNPPPRWETRILMNNSGIPKGIGRLPHQRERGNRGCRNVQEGGSRNRCIEANRPLSRRNIRVNSSFSSFQAKESQLFRPTSSTSLVSHKHNRTESALHGRSAETFDFLSNSARSKRSTSCSGLLAPAQIELV